MEEPDASESRWGKGGSSEPSAELLSGAIAHVEELIRRLEYAPERIEHEEAAAAPRRSAKKSSAKSVQSPAEPPSEVSPAAQAEALRITLNAHDEANRLLGEAAELRARAAAEGQRILADAQRIASELQAEAEAEADRYLTEAQSAAENMRAEAERSMRTAISDATAAANQVHSATQAEAQRVRGEAAAWAGEQRAAAEVEGAERLAQAERDMRAAR